MAASVSFAKKGGFTFIEILAALVIVAVILLGNMAATSLSYRKNLENAMRDEAVKVAQEQLEKYRDSGGCDASVERDFRNFKVAYTVSLTTQTQEAFTKLHVDVTWAFPEGQSHTVSMESYVK